jgi:hypothetical protein
MPRLAVRHFDRRRDRQSADKPLTVYAVQEVDNTIQIHV